MGQVEDVRIFGVNFGYCGCVLGCVGVCVCVCGCGCGCVCNLS